MGAPFIYERATRIAACADYLLNAPLKVIAARHGIDSPSTVVRWMRRNGQFRMRGQGVETMPVGRMK